MEWFLAGVECGAGGGNKVEPSCP